MGVIKLTLPYGEIPVNGKQVTFVAPCPCTETEAIQIDDVQYTVVDSLCKCVTGIGGRWDTGAVVSVILDVDNKRAYLQNSPGGITAETAELLGVAEGATMDVAFAATKSMIDATNASLAATNKALNAANERIDARVRVATGTYVGDGTTLNQNNPRTLTFDFTPQLVIVFDPSNMGNLFGGFASFTDATTNTIMAVNGASKASRVTVIDNYGENGVVTDWFTWGEKTFSWFTWLQGEDPISSSGAVVDSAELNDYGVTYNYIAFGV